MVKTSDAIQVARGLIGTPYGSGPGELDCINLIKAVIRSAPGGVPGYKTAGTSSLWASGNLKDGNKYKDLTERCETILNPEEGMLAFKGKPLGFGGQPHHVGLVAKKAGAWTVIHASSVYGKVVETPLTAREGWTLLAIHRYIKTGAEEEKPVSNTEVQYTARVNTESGNLNLRSGPGKAYPVIRKIPKGEEVGVIMEYETGWAFVQHGTQTGYVSREYLSTTESPLRPADTSPEDGGKEETKDAEPAMHWYVHVPCGSEAQAKALMELIPGAIMVLGGDD